MAPIIGPVAHGVGHQLTGIFGAIALAAGALLPPEHAHRTGIHEHHRPDVVHRHYEPHHPGRHGVTLDHDDDEIINWLDSSFARPSPPLQPAPPLGSIRVAVAIQAPDTDARELIHFRARSVHDPPWITASPLRAPPLLS